MYSWDQQSTTSTSWRNLFTYQNSALQNAAWHLTKTFPRLHQRKDEYINKTTKSKIITPSTHYTVSSSWLHKNFLRHTEDKQSKKKQSLISMIKTWPVKTIPVKHNQRENEINRKITNTSTFLPTSIRRRKMPEGRCRASTNSNRMQRTNVKIEVCLCWTNQILHLNLRFLKKRFNLMVETSRFYDSVFCFGLNKKKSLAG